MKPTSGLRQRPLAARLLWRPACRHGYVRPATSWSLMPAERLSRAQVLPFARSSVDRAAVSFTLRDSDWRALVPCAPPSDSYDPGE